MARSLRDRAIILLCAALAFRGDSVRSLQLSDLGVEDMPFPAIAPGVTVKVSSNVLFVNGLVIFCIDHDSDSRQCQTQQRRPT